MLTQNEIILNLEILRLKSLCRIANKEISTLEDIILENDSFFKTCDEFKNALNEKNNLSYINNFPDLLEQESLLLNNLIKLKG